MSDRTPIISLGAGVQSTTVALLAARGELEWRPRLAVFSDTGWEPRAVYEHLDWLEEELRGRVEVARVSAGNLRDELAAHAAGDRPRISTPPLFVARGGAQGMLRRSCTRDYKLRPIMRELRRRGHGTARPVDQLMGISFDEVERMKSSPFAWARTVYPLVDRRMTRADCLAWLEEHGYPRAPRSACLGCPYHDNAAWRRLRDESPEEWEETVRYDAQIRHLPTVDHPVFLHRDRVPLDEVDLSTMEDRGQLTFLDECEGMCGV